MSADETQFVNGILLLYHHPLRQGASAITEHVNAFKKYSHFNVWNVNTELGFPEGLKRAQSKTLVLHYSLFVPPRHYLDENFLNYIDMRPHSYKIGFFQDEYRFCPQRFAFSNRWSKHGVPSFLKKELHHAISAADLVHIPRSKTILFLYHDFKKHLMREKKP